MDTKIYRERMIESYKAEANNILAYCDAHSEEMTAYVNDVTSVGSTEWAAVRMMYRNFISIYNMVWDEKRDDVVDLELIEIVAGED